MNFKEYLTGKKIDSDAYKASEPEQWAKFSSVFEQMHPKSFTMQKLNLINGIRRQFPYKELVVDQGQVKAKVSRPVMKPKLQTAAGSSNDATKKPVIRPKVSVAKPKMGKPVMKPKISKPIIKPKMESDSKDENIEVTKPKPVMKPKMARPVMKLKDKD
jgi:hypothetical protein